MFRIPSGCDAGAWWHPSFIRGYPQKIQEIVRKPVKGEVSNFPDVPNFFDIPSTPTLQTGDTNQHVAPKISSDKGGRKWSDEELESLQSCHGIPQHVCPSSLQNKNFIRASSLLVPHLNASNTQICPIKRKEESRFQTDEASPAKSSMKKMEPTMILCQPIDMITCSLIHHLTNDTVNVDFVSMMMHQGNHCASTEGDPDELDEFSKFIDNNMIRLP